jgi:DNA-binding CsgD family transcriptional regulator
MQFSADPLAVRIAAVEDIARAAHAFADRAFELGRLRVAPCANIATSRPMTDNTGEPLPSSAFGWPSNGKGWWQDRSLALRSPLPQIARFESEPVWANATGVYRVDGRCAPPAGVDLSMMDGRRVVRAAIVVPVHLPFSQIGVVSFSCMDGRRDDLSEDLAQHGAELGLLASTFISSYVRVTARVDIGEAFSLTRREAECLRWAAVGKTDAEIAEIISRTHGTVRYHLQKSGTKLRAVTRTQAVFKAAQLGYLGQLG